MFGHAGKQLELRHGKPQGGVGRTGGAAHGPPQPGHDIGQHLADRFLACLLPVGLLVACLLPVGLLVVYLVLACVFWRRGFLCGRFLCRGYLRGRYLCRGYLRGRYRAAANAARAGACGRFPSAICT